MIPASANSCIIATTESALCISMLSVISSSSRSGGTW